MINDPHHGNWVKDLIDRRSILIHTFSGLANLGGGGETLLGNLC